MAYCGPRGIPLSEFLSWSPDDQQAALAWQADQNERCPHCGTADWEWEEDRDAYHTEIRACRGCVRRAAAEKDAHNKYPDQDGLQIHLVRREVDGGQD